VSDDSILKENENYRVRLVCDEYAEKPHDDCSAPVLRIEPARAEHVDDGGRPHYSDDAVEDAVNRWGGPDSDGWKYVEKFLRAYLGVTRIDTYYSGNYWYAAYDSADWREYTGVPAGSAENFLAEWRAWIEGEVYGYVVERKVHVEQTRAVSVSGDLVREEESEYDEWEETDSCWGYYGYEWAKQNALEAFNGCTADGKDEG